MLDLRDSWIRFLRAHRFCGIAVGWAVVIACDVMFGSARLDFPFSGGGTSATPLRHEIPLALAVIAVGGLGSAMDSLEETAARGFRRAEICFLVGTVSVAAVLLVVAEAVVSPMDTVLLLLRGLLIWVGLALASGRVWGWRFSWILPLATLFPLTYWQVDGLGRFRWWDWTDQPGHSMPCWGIAIGSLLVGGGAMALTPWRVTRLRRVCQRSGYRR
ncbi:hypothetical protein [Streptomyces nodosus]|uniref:Uncharacterized protein n=1 Tax=Streptomyces nodosus TaxID=40318 RepID=A0A0B5DT71_9ACTN|nr:hypothetical protein [Streptomyces nodosus]AJE43861.1 hypothetical protein SNOD_30590 [Streptomyces nodosus]MBB4795415.1 hypothetical protein [Streptomyces nodosus]QEV42363.1 hypothetical protein CP978_30895 [Streptomyces nodosus]